MAQKSWPAPADARAVTDVEYEMLAAHFSGDGVYGDPSDPAVVSAGVGLTVNIRADVFASVRGHGWTSGSTDDSLTIAPNASGKTRTDRVVLRLNRSTWTVRAVVKEGIPGDGPPTLTTGDGFTTYEVLLANVTVPNGANSVTVTRGERYVGTRIRPCTNTAQTNPNPRLGEVIWETDTRRLRIYDGASWLTVYSDSGEINCGVELSAWSSNAQHILVERSGSVHLRLGSWTREAGTLAAGSESRLPVLIPAQYRHPTRDQYGVGYVTGGERVARFIIYSAGTDRAGQVWLTNKPTIAKGESVMPISGISWVV
ncbi:hypothetical protein [Streptomyces viridosporus]|uniref:hypothetical protein n=1 Tax=Streptomyces viridosporus TaxID=67581 RepID=UPI0036FF48D7